MTGIQLSQFYGIEYADFAAETAKLSLWISEYQMNHLFKDEFGDSPPDLPLRVSGNITHGNAARENWISVCPKQEDTETYVVGNPPYLGRGNQKDEQKEDMGIVFSGASSSFKNLDYVAIWFYKGAEYSSQTNAQCAFVSTNSISQGEQVALLWPLVFQLGVEIGFAHQSFKWKNNASANAAVICVVIGIRKRSEQRKLLYTSEHSRIVKNIGPYLTESDDVFVSRSSHPSSGLTKMEFGNMPIDDGNLILSTDEKQALIEEFPQAQPFIKRLMGSQEFIRGSERWCLWLSDETREAAQQIPPIRQRIEAVKAFRLTSKRAETVELATTPHKFSWISHKQGEALLIPRHFSEDRKYLTIGFFDSESTVISDSASVIYNPNPHVFGVLSSKLHFVWTANVGGRLKSDIRYSNSLVYNTFPFPELSNEQISEIEDHTWKILSARESHAGKTIAWLYNPETMPNDLLQAHQDLDSTLERICAGRSFKNDTERLEYLFKQYTIKLRSGTSGLEPELGLKGRKK